MCLLKNNIPQSVNNGINNSTLEMEDCNQTNGIDTDLSTFSELEDSVIVVDE